MLVKKLTKMPALVPGATRTAIPAPELAARTSRGLVSGTQSLIAGVSAGDWFGPGQPLPAVAPPTTEPRALDYQFSINTQFQTRRTESGVTYAQLRALARGYDLLRLVIETRKDQVAAIPVSFGVERQDGELYGAAKARNDADPRVKELNDFFRNPDGSGWQGWIRKALEEVFVVDALSILPRWTVAGKIGRLEIVDGATIDRKIDAQGRTPEPPSVAYQQILKGLPAINLMAPLPFALRAMVGTPELPELVYRPRNLLADRLYGFSPVEQVITSVNIALRRQMSQLSFYTDGNINDALISVDESWGATEIKRFQDMYDGTAGDQAARRRTRFLPKWSAIVFPRNEVLKDDFDEWLARIVCFAFSVTPTWAVKQVNRATAQQAAETADEEGLAPILLFIEEFLNYLVETFWGYTDIRAKFEDKIDPDPLKRAQVHQIYLDEEVLTRDEVREELGRDPLPDGQGQVPAAAPATESPAQEKSRRPRLLKAGDDPPKAPAVSPDQPLPGRDTAESAIESSVLDVLRKLAPELADEAAEEFQKGRTAHEIVSELDLSDADNAVGPVSEALETIASAGADKALRSLKITETNLFDLANEGAAKWARERGAELVGRKWVDGELVDNPDARWAITDSTRDGIRELIERAYTDGMTPAQLADQIEGGYQFSPARAKLIAKTETATASIKGSLEGWKASGLVEGKQSLLSDDHDGEDECDDAADDGAIPVDESFSTGDDGPPYHPGCNCSLVALMVKE